MKRTLLTLAMLIGIVHFSIFNLQFSIFNSELRTLNFELVTCAQAQVPYGFAPSNAATEDLAGLGGGKNEFVQGMVCFDPTADPVLGRLQGKSILGVRCYLRTDYKQARQSRSGVLASTGKPGNFVRQTYADLLQGWNDVLFDEPLTIGTEPIFLGVQAYETVGAPYPLVTYKHATVPQSCWLNLGKKAWEEQTERGTLLVMALLDDEAASALQRTAYAQNTWHPQTVAPGRDFAGGLYIHNQSPTQSLETLEIAMQGEGATEPTLRTLALPSPIPPLGSTVIEASLRAGLAEGTSVDWTATVTQVNGQEAQPGRPGTTKLYVTHDDFQRTLLVEEFTSQRCINCPQMAYFLDKALEEFDGDYVYLSHHSGFQEDVFTTQPDREVVYIFGGYENEYNPAIMYNRAMLQGENTVIQGIRDMSAEPYLAALTEAAEMPAMAEVNIATDGQTVNVTGRVARDLVDSELYLSCYLVEDGIGTDRYFQKGMDDADAPADLKDVFRHNGVILHYFTQSALGDRLPVNADATYSVAFPCVSKEGFGGTGRRLVAFVHRVDKSNLRDNQVLNAAQLHLNADGIEGVQSSEQMVNGKWANGQILYDLSGRRISTPHRRGIYITQGRKQVVK